ncbi:MAG TPA: hypothetical protein VJ672_01800 [Gemmatimonadaceae bacterium]|nr:hypothetical protein [Gemmatimonadaceae bacterium]
MHFPFRLAAVATALVIAPQSARAQDRSEESPREVAERVLVADSSGDWRTLVALADARSTQWFKRWHVGLARLDRTNENRGLLRYLFGVENASQLDRLPSDSILARFLRATHQPPNDPNFAGLHRRIVGEVVEGDTAAHIVVRTRMGPVPGAPNESTGVDDQIEQEWIDVLTLRLTTGGWRTWLTPSLMGARRLAARRNPSNR